MQTGVGVAGHRAVIRVKDGFKEAHGLLVQKRNETRLLKVFVRR